MKTMIQLASITIILALSLGCTHAHNSMRGAAEFERMLQADIGASCSANPLCAAEGLVDDCCPTKDGTMLDCCKRTCEVHPTCEALADPCCPTKEGVNLECCDFQHFAGEGRNTPVISVPTCSAYEKCAHLADNCCPTASGVMLDCCYGL